MSNFVWQKKDSIMLNIIFLIAGLVLIIWGANALTDGSSAIAKRFGVSDLVIGLTVVAMGTSTPELVISMMSAFSGSADLAIGNVVGSNIFNIFVIIGVTAMVKPIVIERSIMTNEIPLVILSAVALLAIGCGAVLDPGTGAASVTRVHGILLMLFFCIFMRYVFSQSKKADASDPDAAPIKQMGIAKALIYVVLGLAGLVIGGDRFVAGASGIALSLGVSEAVIGLTIVSAGTSLPELATSVVAAMKGRPGMAIGNVIGSNIFNIFLVLGLTATVSPLPFGNITIYDLAVMTAACVAFWLFGWFFKTRTITRAEGAVMAALYVAYIVTLIFNWNPF